MCVFVSIGHFTSPFTVILMGFKETAEHVARVDKKGYFEEVRFELEGSY